MKLMKKYLTPVLLLTLMLLFVVSCGQNPSAPSSSDGKNTAADNVSNDDNTSAPPETTAAQTKAPETTVEVTTYEPIDPSLPYYEQCDIEFSRFGFINALRACGNDEAEVMDKFSKTNVKTETVDLSGEDVPFKNAIRIITEKAVTNFWDANIAKTFTKDLALEVGDIIAGCFWIRDLNNPDPANAYIAIKTPTDEWRSEGNMNINSLVLTDKWQKVYFYGEVINEEPNSNKLIFQLFTGPTPNTVEFGGFYINIYSSDQYKAAYKMP